MGDIGISKEQLLLQVEDLLRSMPRPDELRNEDSGLIWLGHFQAVVSEWNSAQAITLLSKVKDLRNQRDGWKSIEGQEYVTILLHQVRRDLIMRCSPTHNVSISKDAVFDYFDGLRRIIELATQEIFFVDPYLSADFVAKYLPHVSKGVTVRLLTRHKTAALCSSVDAFSLQHGSTIEVRESDAIHDRYIFVDQSAAFQSGASFKDGAKTAPTAIIEVLDAFAALQRIYEGLWQNAKALR